MASNVGTGALKKPPATSPSQVDEAGPIITACAQGRIDRNQAYDELVLLLNPWARATLLRKFPFTDDHALKCVVFEFFEDVVLQQASTIARALEKGIPASRYLRRMLLNGAIDAHNKRKPFEPLDEQTLDLLECGPGAKDAEALIIQAEELAIINEEIERLPAQQDVRAMKLYSGGCKPQEIALTLGLTDEEARNRVTRSIARLKVAVRKRTKQ